MRDGERAKAAAVTLYRATGLRLRTSRSLRERKLASEGRVAQDCEGEANCRVRVWKQQRSRRRLIQADCGAASDGDDFA